jgi:hypothetical protein
MEKGFEINSSISETPNFDEKLLKPLKTKETPIKQKVDINVLRSRIEVKQAKENRKNVLIFTFFLITLAALGIYLSI